MTQDELKQTIRTWCNTSGKKKIEEMGVDLDQVVGELYTYIYLDGNDIISTSEAGQLQREVVMTIYQGLPHHTRNWVAFRIRPTPMGEDIDSELSDKVYTICGKYLTARAKRIPCNGPTAVV